MKTRWTSYLLAISAAFLVFSCSSTSDSKDEFIATLSDFEGYTSWTEMETLYGPDQLLQTAHGANDSLYRTVYVKNNAQPNSKGNYATGTLIVKELRTESGELTGALTMMAKRGADFNPDGNGWEWFMTSTDLTTVLTQGDNATAGGGLCASCHAGANANNNGTDWVFNHNTAR